MISDVVRLQPVVLLWRVNQAGRTHVSVPLRQSVSRTTPVIGPHMRAYLSHELKGTDLITEPKKYVKKCGLTWSSFWLPGGLPASDIPLCTTAWRFFFDEPRAVVFIDLL